MDASSNFTFKFAQELFGGTASTSLEAIAGNEDAGTGWTGCGPDQLELSEADLPAAIRQLEACSR